MDDEAEPATTARTLALWREAERLASVARRGKEAAQVAATAAEEAATAALATAEAARAALEASKLAYDSAARTAESARLVIRAADIDLTHSSADSVLADLEEAAARDRYQDAVADVERRADAGAAPSDTD
jgi:hypothetical protein